MKSSHQTLMLAIFMGLVAWVLDALISWHFFPGKTFYEMLFEYDPQRTLYVRSTVVLLFFLFGLLVGRLQVLSERTQKKLADNLKLSKGVRQFHEKIVACEQTEDLLTQVLPLLESFLDLRYVRYFNLAGAPPEILTVFQGEHPAPENLRTEVSKRLGDFLNGDGFQWLPEKVCGPGCCLISVRLGKRLFGILAAGQPLPVPEEDSSRMDFFRSVCDDLGHALARLEDQQELQRNSEKLQNLYRSAPVGIFTTTVGGQLLFANPAMASILGAASPEALLKESQPVSEFYQNPSRRAEFIRQLRENRYVVDFEAVLLPLTGSECSVILAARLVDDEGENARIEGFAMDVSQSRTAESEKRILQQRLADSQHFKSITVLAGGVAHEFNNILQAMMGSAYLAQLKYPNGKDEIWNYLQDIQNSGKRAARLCDQMLSYAGKKAMLLKQERPDACLVDVLKILEANTTGNVKIVQQLSAPNARVRMDMPSFSEIINQLVTNAREAYPESGGGRIEVSTEVKYCQGRDFALYQMFRPISDDEYWLLKIRDQGSGISGKDLPRIFEPFYTTKFQGRGLGLPSAAGLVEKFDGSLGIRSETDQGTEVALWIPLAETVLVEEPAAPEPKEDPSWRGHGKIWVVDDESLICMTIQRLLTPLGFDVLAANDGQEALEKLKASGDEGIRCLILDITMPRMGGLEMLEKLREFMPDLPVLIMSGYDESDSLEDFKDLKVEGFIHKPFRMESLQARIKEMLG